ncbi:uncharacterized protein LOC135681019 [Rhopilema esculentum]|uniref:uncharacterized protein LOC135681019 n=1 Tax=Rhopilema esculentum TaxID=499914 RepID=UPI0031D4E0B1|eukprot:gene12598-3302_t
MGIRAVKDKKDKEAKQKTRKVVVEFLVHFLFTIVRYGIQSAVFIDGLAFDSRIRLNLGQVSLQHGINTTKTVYYCTKHWWKADYISQQINFYRGVTYTYGFVVVLSAIIAIIHNFVWLLLLCRTQKDPDYPETDGKNLVKFVRIKLCFIENIVHDIPLSVLAISVFVSRVGANGLACLLCTVRTDCTEKEQLLRMISPAAAAVAASLCVISLTTAWRGISVFFKWSYTKECPLVTVRGCASVFAGLIYAVLILTPAFFAIKYQLFSLAVVAKSVGELVGLVDKLLIVGVIAWVLVLSVLCCCPLIRAIS